MAWKRGTDNSHNGMENGRGDRYGYDPEGQLTAASYRAINPETETPSEAMRSDSFSYDALGNRQGLNNYVASLGAVSFTRRDNGLNQYLSWTPSVIYYDDNHPNPPPPPPPVWVFPGNGVMMADGWITASFNALNQPMAMWCPTYGNTFLWFGHDPLGRCVKRWMGTSTGVPVGSNPTTYFYYEGWNLVQEGPNAATSARTYVHGGRVDEIVASEAGGVWRNHHYDARGHCILLTDIGGVIREQYDYDAFGFPYFYTASGSRLSASQQFGNRFLFTGREWLKDLHVYDYRHRHYQPELGRFLQPDPIQFKAGDYNLYRYCHNDPVNRTDPDGTIDTWERLMAWQGGGDGTVSEQMENLIQQRGNRQAHDHHAMGEDSRANGRKSAGETSVSSRTPESTSHATSTNPVEVGSGWERTSEGRWRRIGARYGQIVGKGGTGRTFRFLGPFRIPTIRLVRQIYYDYERTISERAYIEYRAFTVRTTEHVDSTGATWTERRSGNEQWKHYTGETRTREEFRSDYMGTTP